MIPIHKMIRELESQGVVSKTHSPFNSPIWPVRKSHGEWRLTVDYRALNEVTPQLSAAIPDMLELHYELESKAAKCYTTIDIANAFFSIPLAAECRPELGRHQVNCSVKREKKTIAWTGMPQEPGRKCRKSHGFSGSFVYIDFVVLPESWGLNCLQAARMKTEISTGIDETPDPGVDPGVENPEWYGKWEDMGQILKEFSASMVRDGPCDQMQNPAEVEKYLKEKCHNESKEKKIIARKHGMEKSTAALTHQVHELKEGKTQRGSSTKWEAAPVAHSRAARYDDDDDMSDPLEGTSKTYVQGKKDNQA
ncbi:hypothetical protein TURU_006388 [Turdus rufiventris]|nr:hypothetical protein TURU_006388 [Turdus rufiventris]